jgi:hypothetical protein
MNNQVHDYFRTARLSHIYSRRYLLIEVTYMDLFWSGLAQRASEHTWNERRSQFSKVHEMVIQKIENEKQN